MITVLLNARKNRCESARVAYSNKSDGHLCPGCRIPMTLSISIKKNYFGKCAKGYHHADDCPSINLEKNMACRDIEITNIDSLDDAIMALPRKGNGGGGGLRGPRENENRTGLKKLSDFYCLGLCEASDFQLNDKLYLRDVMLNRSTMSTVMRDNKTIGKRIVMVKPDFVLKDTLTIRFCGFGYVGKGESAEKVLKVFDLKFRDKDEFWDCVRKIFDINEIPGCRNRYNTKFDRVLLYGHWSALEYDACKTACKKKCNGQWRCTGYQYAECIVLQHQIYCLPKYKKK